MTTRFHHMQEPSPPPPQAKVRFGQHARIEKTYVGLVVDVVDDFYVVAIRDPKTGRVFERPLFNVADLEIADPRR